MDKKISNATMSRYPIYLKALRKMQHEGKENCLSSELSELNPLCRKQITLGNVVKDMMLST